MLSNPFTPLFGGKPRSFFGREELLQRFARALDVPGSDDRVLFITGTRGSGKTALLEQFSQQAEAQGWRSIDVGAERALPSLYRQLTPADKVTTTLSPAVEVKVLGSGGSLSGKSTARTTSFDIDDLAQLLKEECDRQKKGLLVTIDEVQKVSLDDMARICEAFQMASRKGREIALAVAGLPYAYDEVIHQDGCTFMRRSVHETLNLLSSDEVKHAYQTTFAQIPSLVITPEALESLVRHSSGHPYMMQLLGYQLVELLAKRSGNARLLCSEADAELIAPIALDAYERRSLKPLLDELAENERQFLVAMAATADADFVSRTSDVAAAMGKTPQQTTGYRKKLIDHGIIVPVNHGSVRFNIPYLRAYVQKPTDEEANLAQLEAWGV